ncbi:MAG: UDP-N-acetylmuramate:L-alanyl-gamma-D-glutamyl-meso-diaminopimelate ligase [Pseudomonadales bacterium]|nr:UDP-N-acetylmuramate:L-alanyl-gamma-D-glutamyl-meso-diaminopimelate ligase [Gammaproteobacteria bacterium]MDP6026409.1 UDP-N-acetylmuramate:L-alanyl-gamma-D-glutamyl-meso-diaminopimelate ligase [Pseudomonadales bacterium]MDP6316251.1 UDP-N-acetylmuramate:L-alanyl-gamma-D-glutamyl-meso-diaminopimelate ligase [Pseudomonadales bacterium]
MHIHILGICGTLMGSIALLARQQGHAVTGTDENVYPPMSDLLQNAGIDVNSPYTAENIPTATDLVIIGNANLPRGNVAVEYVLEKNIPYTSGAEYLGRYLLHDKWVIAVAGTHGKTTTTSMIAWILEFAGMNPGFLVGGVPTNFSESARLGETPFFVIEADEYDTSYFDRRSKFLHYRPRTLILNNLEYDHADIFPDLSAIQNQFHLLIRTVPAGGLVIFPAGDANLTEVLAQGIWSQQLPIGPSGVLSATSSSADSSEFNIILNGEPVGSVKWSLSGSHNVANALSAIAAARHVGVTPDIACDALGEFKGVKRRMEQIYTSANLTVYDDFAHHPTAIMTTLHGLRQKVDKEKILAIIEPGSHTMRKGTHSATLKPAVKLADDVFWYQPDNISWDMQAQLTDSNCHFFMDIDELAKAAVTHSEKTQHIVIMSNSGFGGLHKKILARLPAE